jgi:D-alanine-D-alanine ligase
VDKKIKIGFLFGGKSAEHEISLISAKNIVNSLDKTKYEPVLIGIDKNGRWHLRDAVKFLNQADNPKLVHLSDEKKEVVLTAGQKGSQLINIGKKDPPVDVDIIFPVMHGTYGEDGTIQGFLKLAGVPFIGASVLGSAIGMDKDVMKRLLRDANIPIASFVTINARERSQLDFFEIQRKLGLPLFVKPANLGSSVGVSKVKRESDFFPAIEKAFLYDSKILIEEFIDGREIECSLLGNDHPICSLPGEVLAADEFYSYEAKYIDDSGTQFKIPAELTPSEISRIQETACKTYQVLCCEGMARVDLFLKKDGSIIINEINTIPGFTKMSLYPRLWEASGMSFPQLIDQLVELAFERFQREKGLKTTF